MLGLLISLLVMTLVFLLICQRLAKGVLMVLLMVILVSRVLARELGPRRRCLRRQQIERGRPARTSARKIKRKIKAFVFSGGGSPSLGVARNKLSARNHCQFKGRDSNPCPGYHMFSLLATDWAQGVDPNYKNFTNSFICNQKKDEPLALETVRLWAHGINEHQYFQK